MGPLQCCASHCKHERKSADDAQRCCALHLGALQKSAKQEFQAPALTVPPIAAATPSEPRHDPSTFVRRIPSTAHHRALPARSLLAQHTALQR
jgi:hypothetical protein